MHVKASFCIKTNRFRMHHLLRVIPVIGILSDKNAFQTNPNVAEVEAVFDAPLEMFPEVFSLLSFLLIPCFDLVIIFFPLHPHTKKVEKYSYWMKIEDWKREWMGDKYLVHFFDYEANDEKYNC